MLTYFYFNLKQNPLMLLPTEPRCYNVLLLSSLDPGPLGLKPIDSLLIEFMCHIPSSLGWAA